MGNIYENFVQVHGKFKQLKAEFTKLDQELESLHGDGDQAMNKERNNLEILKQKLQKR